MWVVYGRDGNGTDQSYNFNMSQEIQTPFLQHNVQMNNVDIQMNHEISVIHTITILLKWTICNVAYKATDS